MEKYFSIFYIGGNELKVPTDFKPLNEGNLKSKLVQILIETASYYNEQFIPNVDVVIECAAFAGRSSFGLLADIEQVKFGESWQEVLKFSYLRLLCNILPLGLEIQSSSIINREEDKDPFDSIIQKFKEETIASFKSWKKAKINRLFQIVEYYEDKIVKIGVSSAVKKSSFSLCNINSSKLDFLENSAISIFVNYENGTVFADTWHFPENTVAREAFGVLSKLF